MMIVKEGENFMTVIATYRLNDYAFYVNDFRVTMQEPFRQFDVSYKFMDFDRRLGLFFAGDVNLWKKVVKRIPSLMKSVTIENILDQFGPFVQGINNEVQMYPRTMFGRAEAIGFLIDDERKINAQFCLELYPGQGCLIKEIVSNSCVVIGSGKSIPNIEEHIKENFIKNHEVYGDAPYELVCGIRNEIQVLLKMAGSSSFSKLGISPCMSVSTLVGSHFMIRGEEINGQALVNNKLYEYCFAFERDANGDIVLNDLINNTKQIVNDINNMNSNIQGSIFDPQKLTEDVDIADRFLDADKVYLIDQWVPSGENLVLRSVYVINIINFKGKRICDPERRKIAYKLITISDDCILKRFREKEKLYFTLDDDKVDNFEENIQKRLYDHVWLSEIIPDYCEIYNENLD